MSIAWYVCPYKRDYRDGRPTRYCAMDDYTAALRAEGGDWSETEVLGSVALVKVRASDTSLATLGTRFFMFPKNRLSESLSDLTPEQKLAIVNRLTDMGYTTQELHDAFPNDLSTYTLRDVLHFAARRRLCPRYDPDLDEIICDGPVQPVRAVENVDAAVGG
jgi:hypothetical protein